MRGDLDRKATKEEARERTLDLLRKRGKPTFIGEVALAIGPLWSLEEAEALLEQLVREGFVLRTSDAAILYQIVDD